MRTSTKIAIGVALVHAVIEAYVQVLQLIDHFVKGGPEMLMHRFTFAIFDFPVGTMAIGLAKAVANATGATWPPLAFWPVVLLDVGLVVLGSVWWFVLALLFTRGAARLYVLATRNRVRTLFDSRG